MDDGVANNWQLSEITNKNKYNNYAEKQFFFPLFLVESAEAAINVLHFY